jgi:iron complex outermembrane receptor protein
MRTSNLVILSSVSLLALSATPALAQAVPAAPADTIPQETEQVSSTEQTNAQGESNGAIVVTGSRLRRDNFQTPQNVDVITRDDQVLAGTRSTAEVLQSGTVTSGTSQISGSFLGFLSQGGQGANLVGLRGLGAQRTLILLNGRRLAPAGVGPQLVAADLNVLPTSVVQRIEVLREGASSVYGSDAIAGVINVITDTRMNGLTLDAFSDVPLDADGGRTYRVSLTAGVTFDRGYVTGAFEYREDTGMTLGDRNEFSCPRELAFVNGVEVGQGSPGDPTRVRCFPYAPRLNTGVASGYALTNGFRPFPNYVNTGRQILNPNGTLTQITNDAQRPLGDITNALRQTVFTPVRTYTAFLSAGYEIGALGDAELYGEALFTRRQSNQEDYSTQTYQAAFRDADLPAQLYFGNIQGLGISCEEGFGLEYCSPFAPTALANLGINYFGPLISLRRTLPSSQQVDFFRANAGIRGNLGLGDWRYDANAMMSRTESEDRFTSALATNLSNTVQAVLAPAATPERFTAVAGPGTARPGRYTCAVNVTSGAYNGGSCVPVNIFDPNVVNSGQLPAEFYDYVFTESVSQTTYQQETFNIVFDGSLFSLPGGRVRAAIGAEHRRDFIDDVPSFQRQQGILSGGAVAQRTTGSDRVTEVFGELHLPILADRPFFNILEVRGSARYTHYESYGSGFTYSLNGQWAPISNIRFRANYGTNFRAPNLYEQFIADQIGFYPASVDPCDNFAANYQPGETVYVNCLAALTPILGADAINYQTSGGSVRVTTSGGRDVLDAEKATTWGLGVVLTAPREFADFALAIDYFNVEVRGEVELLGNLLLNFCYESEDFPNAPECQFIGPRITTAGGVNRGQLTTLRDPYLNIARQRVQGLDFDARYARDVLGGRFSTQLQATRFFRQETENFAGAGLVDFNGTLGYPGAGAGPKWVGSLDTRFTTADGVTLRWGVEYVGRAETERRDFGLTATGLSCTIGAAGCFVAQYDQVAEPYWEHGVSVQWLWRNVGQVTMGVNNVFNQDPPTVAAYPGSSVPTRIGNFIGNGPYNYRGRSFFINVTRSF